MTGMLRSLFLCGVAASMLTPALAQTAKPTANLAAPVKKFGRVSYDARSLMIDGKRLTIWSAEVHAIRLPSPHLSR